MGLLSLNCFMLAITLWLLKQCLLHNIAEKINKKVQKKDRKINKNEKRCRNGVPKSTQTRKDIKVKVNIQSPSLHVYSFVK